MIFDEFPVIDPRNEDQLTEDAKVYAYKYSKGALRDFTKHSPLDALIRTQAYTAAEFLFWAQNSIKAFVARFLELTGETRSLGVRAKAPVRFTLTAARPGVFRVPKNFELQGTFDSKTYSYFLEETIEIQPGQTTGVGTVVAAKEGKEYNLPAGFITRFIQPLNFLKEVVSTENAQGGRLAETEDEAIARALAQIRTRGLVSLDDHIFYATKALGVGSRAIAVARVAADQISYEAGSVHVFLLSADGKPANQSQLDAVNSDLQERRLAGTRVYVSPVNLVNVNADVILKLKPRVDPVAIADQLWAAYTNYVNPINRESGKPLLIDEVKFELRFTDGIDFIEDLKLNGLNQPIQLPNQWSLPVADFLNMNMITSEGTLYETLRGNNEGGDIDSVI